MKRFRFRLARLERLRDLERREARGELSRSLIEARQRSEVRERRETAVERSRRTELPDELRGDPDALRRQSAWREGQRRLLEHAMEQEREAGLRVAAGHEKHTEAARSHRVLSRLRERRRRRWRKDAELEEQKFLDEIHLLRRLRTQEREED